MKRWTVVVGSVAILAMSCGDDDASPASQDQPQPQPPQPEAGTEAGTEAGPPPGTSPTWRELPALPAPQQETAVVALDGKVYVIGGLLAGGQPTNEVRVYDPAARTWASAAPLPEPLHHVNAAVAGGRIWIVGALRTVAFTAVGTTLSYDPAANAWTPRAGMPAGTERGASMVGAIGTKVYVAGGFRGGAVAEVSSFDTVTEQWAALPALETARDHGMAGVVSGILYAIGGRGGAVGSHVARVDAFDPVTAKWTPRAAMPTSRGGAAAAVVKGLIVVAGGEGKAGKPSGVFEEVEAYDPARDAWSALPSMRTPRHGTGAATVGDVVIVPGGGDVQALGATAVVEELVF